MGLRRHAALAPVATLALSAFISVGCGSTDSGTPAACLEGPGAYLKPLEAAPAAVKLAGGTSISECLPENQAGGDLAAVGGAMVTAATRLDAEARAEPGGGANLQLGYLVGAAQRGADSTQGIHAELLRRLAFAARYSPDNRPLPPAFMSAYQRGFDAGHERG